MYKKLVDFCKKNVGKCLQLGKMKENKSFIILDVTPKAFEMLQDYIATEGIDVTASYDDNGGSRPRLDKNGKPYPPSVFVNYDAIDVSDWGE